MLKSKDFRDLNQPGYGFDDGFDDILSTDHKLIKFVLNFNFNIPKTIVTNRLVYNFKNANWLVSGKFFFIPLGTYVLFQTMLILHGQAGVIYFFRQ